MSSWLKEMTKSFSCSYFLLAFLSCTRTKRISAHFCVFHRLLRIKDLVLFIEDKKYIQKSFAVSIYSEYCVQHKKSTDKRNWDFSTGRSSFRPFFFWGGVVLRGVKSSQLQMPVE